MKYKINHILFLQKNINAININHRRLQRVFAENIFSAFRIQ